MTSFSCVDNFVLALGCLQNRQSVVGNIGRPMVPLAEPQTGDLLDCGMFLYRQTKEPFGEYYN